MKFSKDKIKPLQSAIKNLGIDVGPIDGIAGSKTISGMEKALSAVKGDIDITPETPERPPSPTIKDPAAATKVVKGWSPRVVTVKGVSYKKRGRFQTPLQEPDGAVVHYTVSGNSAKSAESVVRSLAARGLGCPVVDGSGTIYVPEGFDWERDIAYHAGASAWKGKSSVSNRKIGFEMCGWGSDAKKQKVPDDQIRIGLANNGSKSKNGYQKFTPEQEEFLVNVMVYLKNKYPKTFSYDGVCGHDECATPLGRKNDPGASLSMSMPAFRTLLKSI